MIAVKHPMVVNEAVVRGVAVQVLLLSLAAVLWGSLIPVVLVMVDFAVRVILGPRYSVLALVSKKGIAPLFRFKEKKIPYRPKRFAAGIGLFLSLAAFFLGVFDQILVLRLVMGLLSFFSLLEAFFRFCAGCKIFSLLVRLGLADEGLCTDCVYPGGDGI